MEVEDIRLLYRYDRWANHRMLDLVAALTPEQFTRDLGGSYASVRDVLRHMLAGQCVWLAYWKEPVASEPVRSEAFSRMDDTLTPDRFPNFDAWKARWEEVEEEVGNFVDSVTPAMLERRLMVVETPMSLAHLLQHVTNHASYHRGQIALMLRQLGAEAQCVDLAEYLLAVR